MYCDGVIIGAGIIGSALAYELASRGAKNLHVLDPDLAGALSATERNAGGVRHLWQHPINVELSRASIALFRRIHDRIGFQQTGYLWLHARGSEAEARQTLEVARARGLDYEEWSVADIRTRYPFIDRTDDLALGIFGPRDGLINSNALKQYYRDEAKRLGVTFHDRRWVTSISEAGNSAWVEALSVGSEEEAATALGHPEGVRRGRATPEVIECGFVALCAGAWMSRLLSGLLDKPLVRPVRRQISVFRAEGFDMTPYGMVVDTSRVYFHPEGGKILAGRVVADEPDGFSQGYDPDFFETQLWPALYERSSSLERLRHVTGWGGLYSYTPDMTGILGRLPGYKRIFESHGYTGRGVMQSYGAALAAADLILEGRFSRLDGSVLSRERFRQPASDGWLSEGLHI